MAKGFCAPPQCRDATNCRLLSVQVRNPKSEGRNPKNFPVCGLVRASDFFRPPDFGFRISAAAQTKSRISQKLPLGIPQLSGKFRVQLESSPGLCHNSLTRPGAGPVK